MEEQKRKKEAEEAEIRRQEEERKLKAEMEVRRKQEEEKRRRQEEADKKKLASMQEDLDRANARLAEQREQERRDHEIAVRLAEETGGGVEDLAPSLKRSSAGEGSRGRKEYVSVFIKLLQFQLPPKGRPMPIRNMTSPNGNMRNSETPSTLRVI